jgi:hypothetical protein
MLFLAHSCYRVALSYKWFHLVSHHGRELYTPDRCDAPFMLPIMGYPPALGAVSEVVEPQSICSLLEDVLHLHLCC